MSSCITWLRVKKTEIHNCCIDKQCCDINCCWYQIISTVISVYFMYYRFLRLCIHCEYGTLRQLALDTLSNLSAQFVLDLENQPKTQTILDILINCIMSNDKFSVVTGKLFHSLSLLQLPGVQDLSVILQRFYVTQF